MKYSELMENKERKFSDLPISQRIIFSVRNDIFIGDRKLTSLVGSPERVKGDFNCDDNQLTTLVGGPKYVGGCFQCSGNKLVDLIGAPEIIGGYFVFGRNDYTISLKGITTKQIGGDMLITGAFSGALELFKIKGIKTVVVQTYQPGNYNTDIQYIINCHISKGIRGMLQCQAELIAAGYKNIL